MKEILIQYIPVAITFVMVVFNIFKTIRGLNVVNPEKHIDKLKSDLSYKYDVIVDKLDSQQKINNLLANAVQERDNKLIELESKMLELQDNINNKFEEQNDKLTNIVRNDVEIKAEVRKNDIKGL